MTIRGCRDDDLERLHAIQSLCPQAAQWRPQDYLHLAHDPLGTILVADIEQGSSSRLVGFAAFHRVLDDAELRNLAVDPSHQRQGIARALLAAGIQALRVMGSRRLLLEVRASNRPAVALYHAAKFHLLYTRRNYYKNPDEDALIMVRGFSTGTDVPVSPHQ
jgi:ribosomal-protein-alanine N-acetyltransferase